MRALQARPSGVVPAVGGVVPLTTGAIDAASTPAAVQGRASDGQHPVSSSARLPALLLHHTLEPLCP